MLKKRKNELEVFTSLLLLGSIITVFLYWDPDPTVVNYPSSGSEIIAYGDSLVEGVGSTEGYDFVSLLSEQIGQAIINLGRSGDTTADGLARLHELQAYHPKVVLLLLGGNDFLQRVPKEETFQNLEVMIRSIQQTGSMVVVLGVRGGFIKDGYERDYRTLAKQLGAAYVPNVLAGLFGNERYMSDPIHPNDAGYAIIARRIYPVLKPLLD